MTSADTDRSRCVAATRGAAAIPAGRGGGQRPAPGVARRGTALRRRGARPRRPCPASLRRSRGTGGTREGIGVGVGEGEG